MANVYKPALVSVTVGGAIITGKADGEWANLEYADEGARMVVGADGEATHVIPSDTSGTLTLTLKQDSASNAVLGAFVLAGTQVKVGITDSLGYSSFSKDCLVRQHSSAGYSARELSNRVWVINMPAIQPTYPAGTTF